MNSYPHMSVETLLFQAYRKKHIPITFRTNEVNDSQIYSSTDIVLHARDVYLQRIGSTVYSAESQKTRRLRTNHTKHTSDHVNSASSHERALSSLEIEALIATYTQTQVAKSVYRRCKAAYCIPLIKVRQKRCAQPCCTVK